MLLTDIACRNLQPKDKPYKKSDGQSLFLIVNPNGSKLWRMKYRFAGKERSLSIGSYPEVTLKEAREKRDQARKLLSQNKDPSLEKQEEKRLAAISHTNTFEAIARTWHEKNKAKWSEKHARIVMRRLEMDVFPQIGNLPIKEITTPRVAALVEKVEKRGVHDVPRRVLQYCDSIFDYANIIGLIPYNPASFKASRILVERESKNFAAIKPHELPEFLQKLYSNQGRPLRTTFLAMNLMMLTFVRTGELTKARWSEFDFEKRIWCIPAERMKMRREHHVPLSNQAMAILEELKAMHGHRPYVFPGHQNPLGHMSNNAILTALHRMGYRGKHTGHGFRALAATTLRGTEGLEYGRDIVEAQLSHVIKSDVEAAYNRATYMKQRAIMMQDWADYIDSVAINCKR